MGDKQGKTLFVPFLFSPESFAASAIRAKKELTLYFGTEGNKSVLL
jgi:hypothetical protein